MKKQKLSTLRPDQKNANKGTEYGQHLLRKSIQELGVGRGIVVANDGTIIGGNQTVNMLSELGIEDIIVVPTDGNTLVVTQRMDIAPGSREFHELALADNRVGQVNLNFDTDVVDSLGTEFGIDLESWGLGFGTDEEDEENGPASPPKTQYCVIVHCPDETSQQMLHNELVAKGYDCKLSDK